TSERLTARGTEFVEFLDGSKAEVRKKAACSKTRAEARGSTTRTRGGCGTNTLAYLALSASNASRVRRVAFTSCHPGFSAGKCRSRLVEAPDFKPKVWEPKGRPSMATSRLADGLSSSEKLAMLTCGNAPSSILVSKRTTAKLGEARSPTGKTLNSMS